MLQNILNLEGVTILGKKEQKGIQGGYQCNLTLIHSDGSREMAYVFGTSDDPGIQTQAAQNGCGQALSDTNDDVSRCFYDCSHDGLVTN